MKTKQTKTAAVGGVILGVVLGIMSHHFLVARAGNLEPTDPPGPTMKTLDEVEPRIPIPASATAAAPFVINSSGSYYLAGNRRASGNGIEVNADNVTIDLMGYSLIGPGKTSGTNYGIYMYERKNVEIRNGIVRDFGSNGIHEERNGGTGHRVIDVRAMSNGGDGIYLDSFANLIRNCTVEGNGQNGIYAYNGSLVTGCVARDNDNHGIYVRSGCTVINNMACNNDGDGILTSSGSTVIGNTGFSNRSGYGINAATRCTVTGNTAYDNEGGIGAGSGSTVTGNTACNNLNYGIFAGGDCLIDNNTAVSNNLSGGGYTNLYTGSGCVLGLNKY